MAKKSEKQKKEDGLWIPNHIRNISRSVLGDSEKMLLAEIYSFSNKGFYKANDTIAKEYMTSERTVSRWIAKIVEGGFVYVKSPKGYYRTFWAKSHPDVQASVKLYYNGKEVPKNELESEQGKSSSLRQNCPSKLDKTGEVSTTKPVSGLGQSCPPTNKKTNKETNRKTKATPSPLPAGGQAPALLEDRKKEQQADIEKLKAKIGLGKRKIYQSLSGVKFEQNKQKQLKALLKNKNG